MGCSGAGLAAGLGAILNFTLPARKTRSLSDSSLRGKRLRSILKKRHEMSINYFAFAVVILCGLVATADEFGTTYAEDFPSPEVLAALEKAGDRIQDLVGREIGGRQVNRVTHVTRLDPRSPCNKDLGLSLTFSRPETVDANRNFADFQFHTPTDGDAIHFTYAASQGATGKLYAVVFNVFGFGDFTHQRGVTVGEGPAKSGGRHSGVGGVCHIPKHFVIPKNESITLSLIPKTDDRWWFASCDLYLLE